MEIGLIIAFIIVLYVAYAMYSSKRFQKLCLEMFEAVFSNEAVIPECKFQWSYGYPSFTLVFPTNSDLAHAKESGITRIFESEVEKICANSGSKKHPFKIGQAVWLTSKEELNSIRINGVRLH